MTNENEEKKDYYPPAIPKEEKLELLKRGEIRTMQKDIERLREKEAQKERERIAALKTEEEERKERERIERIRREAEERRKAEEEARRREEALRKVEEEKRKEMEEKLEKEEEKKIVEEIRKRAEELEKPVELPPKVRRVEGGWPPPEKPALPRKPSFFEKVFIRVAVIIILLLVLTFLFTFWYWYFQAREAPPAVPEKPPVEEVIPEEAKPEPKRVEGGWRPEIVILPALISVEKTKTLEISEAIQIPDLISKVLGEELKEEAFIRILIKNIPENRWLTLKEFLGGFQVKTPENFYQKLGENYTFFIYSQKQGKRIGFIAKIEEKEGLVELLKPWEGSMEGDFENLFLLMGKEKPALVPYFRKASYKEIPFRYQTFSGQDLGICYSVFNDYFIFTGSWESMKKIIDKLTK